MVSPDVISLTPHHAKYYAHDLTRRAASGMDRLSMALFDASVDLNPHQIEAALFALQNPLSKGVILADEVGLGKTIEAGIVLCQYWAERRRRLLILCPASLRKQWALEAGKVQPARGRPGRQGIQAGPPGSPQPAGAGRHPDPVLQLRPFDPGRTAGHPVGPRRHR